MNKLPLLLLAALLGACTPAEDGTVHTDSDTWMLLIDTARTTGWQDLDVTVLDMDSEPIAGLTLEADVTMPAMGHGSDEDVEVSEPGDGVYRVRAHFQMEGAWELAGTLRDGETSDTFTVELDVAAE